MTTDPLKAVNTFSDGWDHRAQHLWSVLVEEALPVVLVLAVHSRARVASFLQLSDQRHLEFTRWGVDDDFLIANVAQDIEQCRDLAALRARIEIPFVVPALHGAHSHLTQRRLPEPHVARHW